MPGIGNGSPATLHSRVDGVAQAARQIEHVAAHGDVLAHLDGPQGFNFFVVGRHRGDGFQDDAPAVRSGTIEKGAPRFWRQLDALLASQPAHARDRSHAVPGAVGPDHLLQQGRENGQGRTGCGLAHAKGHARPHIKRTGTLRRYHEQARCLLLP